MEDVEKQIHVQTDKVALGTIAILRTKTVFVYTTHSSE